MKFVYKYINKHNLSFLILAFVARLRSLKNHGKIMQFEIKLIAQMNNQKKNI